MTIDNLYRLSILNAFAAISILSIGVVHAQAGFGATGQSGPWQAGQSQHASSDVSNHASNGGSSWTAGTASFSSRTQRGGLWQETSASNTPLPSPHIPSKETGSLPQVVAHTTTLTSKLSFPTGSKIGAHSMSQSSHGAPGAKLAFSSGKSATKSKSGSKSFATSFRSSSGQQSSASSSNGMPNSTSP